MIQGKPENVKSVPGLGAGQCFSFPSDARKGSAFVSVYNKVEESGRMLFPADRIWPDLSPVGWNETESGGTGL